MANEWDTAMQEQFDKLRDDLTELIETRTDAILKQAEGHSRQLSKQAEENQKRLTASVEEGQKRLAASLEDGQKRLSASFKVGMEELHERVKTAAETWGGSLDGIKQSLDELNATVGTRLGDHDKVLANHRDRIETLEGRGAV